MAGRRSETEKLLLLRDLPVARTSSAMSHEPAPATAFRECLMLKIQEHRAAVIGSFVSSHKLPIEREKWKGTAPDDSLCRFCLSATEDECRALFGCTPDEIICG